MASLRISIWVVLLVSVVSVNTAPFGGGHHHTHTIFHVPTRVHTVHHHHVKKVPVYVHHKHTHHHHEIPSASSHEHLDDDFGGGGGDDEFEDDFHHHSSWHARNDGDDAALFDQFDDQVDGLEENDFEEDDGVLHHY